MLITVPYCAYTKGPSCQTTSQTNEFVYLADLESRSSHPTELGCRAPFSGPIAKGLTGNLAHFNGFRCICGISATLCKDRDLSLARER